MTAAETLVDAGSLAVQVAVTVNGAVLVQVIVFVKLPRASSDTGPPSTVTDASPAGVMSGSSVDSWLGFVTGV